MNSLLISLIFLTTGIFSAHKLENFQTCILFILIILLYFYYYGIINENIKFFDKLSFKMYVVKLMFFIMMFGYGFITSYFIVIHKNEDANKSLYQKLDYKCEVLDVEKRTKNYKLLIYLKDIKERVEIYISENDEKISTVLPGDEIVVEGILTKIDESSNLGEYNEKQNKREKRIFFNFSGKLISVKNKNKFYKSICYKIRNKVNQIYDNVLSAKDSGVIKAMIIGESQYLDDDTKTLYKGGGIYHILAISGLHVSIVAMFVKSILNKIKLNIKLNKCITISTLVFYMILTGMAVSTIRATIMHVFSEIAELLERKYNSNAGLIVAAILLLMLNPSLLFSVSFILSFASVTAIKYRLKLHRIFKSQEANISVFLFMLPLLIYNFYSIQGLSVLANIFILPLTSVLVITSFFVLLFYNINSNVVLICGKMISFILKYYEDVLTYLSKLDGFDIIIGKIDVFFLILWYVGYFFLFKICKFDKHRIEEKIKKIKYTKYLAILIFIALIFNFFISYNQRFYVTFCDVEHGDGAIIFDSAKESVILIDGGGTSNNLKDVGNYIIYPYLKYEGINKIDVAIVSHFDRDHAKALLELIDLIKIENIVISKLASRVELYEQVMQKAKTNGIKVIIVSAGDVINVNGVTLEVLYPFCGLELENLSENNLSLVVQVIVNNKKLLFTGDIEKEAEKVVLDKMNFEDICIFKVPHHGSDSSSTYEFVNNVNSKYAIVSCDNSNWKNFKQKNMWKYKGTKILSTFKNGMIKIEIKK